MRKPFGTFGNRFNKFTGERGHVFQGRYKALLVDPGRSLVRLVNYIHLNPVRAKLVDLAHLKDYSLSSYPKYFRREVAAPLLRKDFLSECGLPDSLAGMCRYVEQLELQEEADQKKKNALQKK